MLFTFSITNCAFFFLLLFEAGGPKPKRFQLQTAVKTVFIVIENVFHGDLDCRMIPYSVLVFSHRLRLSERCRTLATGRWHSDFHWMAVPRGRSSFPILMTDAAPAGEINRLISQPNTTLAGTVSNTVKHYHYTVNADILWTFSEITMQKLKQILCVAPFKIFIGILGDNVVDSKFSVCVCVVPFNLCMLYSGAMV